MEQFIPLNASSYPMSGDRFGWSIKAREANSIHKSYFSLKMAEKHRDNLVATISFGSLVVLDVECGYVLLFLLDMKIDNR